MNNKIKKAGNTALKTPTSLSKAQSQTPVGMVYGKPCSISQHKKMKLLPYENVEYETMLSLEEIRERLSIDIEPERLFRLPTKSHKKFQGSFDDNVFDIRPIVEGRNSFLPMIKGTIHDAGDKRTVNIQMRPHILVILFLCFWYGLLIKMTIPFIEPLLTEGKYNPITPVLGIFYLFAYVLTMIGFKPESEKAIDYFEELFEKENNVA